MQPELQTRSAATAGPVPGAPQFNALKHGLYSNTILLPGDDAAEFERRRLVLYRTYRPQTEDEAEQVESMAELRWLRQRYRPVQARFDLQWVDPESDEAGRVCEPLGHQRIHSSIDVTLHRLRVERAWNKARAALFLLQKQRRLGLVEGALKLPPHCYMDSSGAVFGPVLAPVTAPVAAPITAPVRGPVRGPGRGPISDAPQDRATECESTAAPTDSADGQIGNSEERKEWRPEPSRLRGDPYVAVPPNAVGYADPSPGGLRG